MLRLADIALKNRMLRSLLALLPLLVLSAAATAQNARDGVLIDATPSTASRLPVVDCRNLLSAIAFIDTDAAGNDEVWVATSDDRGIDWNPAVRIDQDTSGSTKTTQTDAIYVYGDTIYVAWSDTRNGNVEVYMNHSNDDGVTWQGEQLIDKGYAAGVSTIESWAMRVSPRVSDTFNRVYFLFATTRPGSSDESLYFTASQDGAINFVPAILLPAGLPAGTGDIANIAIDHRRLEADLFVAWQDNRVLGNNSYDVYAQQSTDGGVTWRPSDRRLNSVDGSANGDLDLSIAGPWYIVGWLDDRAGAGTHEVQYNTTSDYGQTWLPSDEKAGNYTVGVANALELDVLLNREILMVSWIDDRSGTPEAYMYSNDTFSANGWAEFQMSSGGAVNLVLDGHHDNCGTTWKDLATNQQVSTFSWDQGATWLDPQVEVSTTSGAVSSKSGLSFNKNFSNFIMGWDADDLGTSNIYAGGYRPQTLTPIGPLTKGSSLKWQISHYPLTNATYDFGVFYAAAPGFWRAPDGRVTGLARDNYLLNSFNTLSNFKGVISLAGTGTTGSLTIPTNIPDFTNLYCISVGAGAVRNGRGAMTDVLEITILP